MSELNLGKKLQMYRTARAMSIRELSDVTSITSSMLSQIEHDQVNPSINSLKIIAEALSIPLFRFFQDDTVTEPFVRSDRRKTIGRADQTDDAFYELLTPDTLGNIEFCMMIIPPHADSADSIHCHIGEEVAYLIEGDSVGIVIEDNAYVLYKNDSIRIKPFSKHVWKNSSDQVVKVIFAINPPSF